jgi:hypothetical protein
MPTEENLHHPTPAARVQQIEQLGQHGTRTRLRQSFDDIQPDRLEQGSSNIRLLDEEKIQYYNCSVYSS